MAKIQFKNAHYCINEHDAIYELIGVSNDMFEMKVLGYAKYNRDVEICNDDIILATLGSAETPLPFAMVGDNMYVLIDTNNNSHDAIICTYVDELYGGNKEEETPENKQKEEQTKIPVYTCIPHRNARQEEDCWLYNEAIMYMVIFAIALGTCKIIHLVFSN